MATAPDLEINVRLGGGEGFTPEQEIWLTEQGCPSTAIQFFRFDADGRDEHIPCRSPHEVMAWLAAKCGVMVSLDCHSIGAYAVYCREGKTGLHDSVSEAVFSLAKVLCI